MWDMTHYVGHDVTLRQERVRVTLTWRQRELQYVIVCMYRYVRHDTYASASGRTLTFIGAM